MGDDAMTRTFICYMKLRARMLAGVPKAPPGLPSKLHEARYLADIQTDRLLGQLKASIRCLLLCSSTSMPRE